MVLVQISTMSTPAPSRTRAALLSRSAATSQDPLACMAWISAKSTEYSTHSAECSPPSSSRTSWSSNR